MPQSPSPFISGRAMPFPAKPPAYQAKPANPAVGGPMPSVPDNGKPPMSGGPMPPNPPTTKLPPMDGAPGGPSGISNPPIGGPVNAPTGGNPFTPAPIGGGPNLPKTNFAASPWVNPANNTLPWEHFGPMLQHFADWHNQGFAKPAAGPRTPPPPPNRNY